MLVSIYIPTKNRVDSLKIAVESALNQTYQDIELIIVNDGATDGTHDYLVALANNDARVKYIQNKKSIGAPAARNLAIKQASGYFVTGLDDDDKFEPYHIESLVNYWQLLENAQQEFSAIYVQDKLKKINEIRVTKKWSSVQAEDLFFNNAIGNQLFSTKERYVNAGLFNEDMPAWQDLDFFYRFLKKHGNAKLLDISSHVFDISPRGDRISTSNKEKIISAYQKFVESNNIHSSKEKHLLLSQVFSDWYGFKVTFSDVLLVLKTGWNLKAFLKILRKWINVI